MEGVDGALKEVRKERHLEYLLEQEKRAKEMIDELDSVEENLGKKATFVDAVEQATLTIRQYDTMPEPAKQKIFAISKRTGQLLKSRYTMPNFWRAGRDLFIAAEKAFEQVRRQL